MSGSSASLSSGLGATGAAGPSTDVTAVGASQERAIGVARVSFEVQFFAPYRKFGVQTTEVPRAGLRHHFIGPNDFVWIQLRRICVTVPSADWARSRMDPGTVYFSPEAGQTPSLDLGAPIMQQQDIATYWDTITQSEGGNNLHAIRFVNVRAVVATPHFVPNMSIGARQKTTQSRYISIPRGDLEDAFVACVGPSRLRELLAAPATGPRRCVLEWLLATYKARIDKWRSGTAAQRRFMNIECEMNFEGLHRFFFFDPACPDAYEPCASGADVLVSVDQMRRWFEVHHTKLVVLGPDDDIIPGAGFVPVDNKSYLPAGTVKVVNRHLFPLNNDLGRLHHVEGKPSRIRALMSSAPSADAQPLAPRPSAATIVPAPSVHFDVKPRVPPAFVADLCDIVRSPLEVREERRNGTATYVADLTGSVDCRRVFWELRARGIEAGVRFRDGELIGLTLRVDTAETDDVVNAGGGIADGDNDDDGGNDGDDSIDTGASESKHGGPNTLELRLSQLPTPRGETPPLLTTRTEYDEYTAAATALRTAAINARMRSTYSPGLAAALELGQAGLSYGRHDTCSPAADWDPFPATRDAFTYLAIDANRAYTSCFDAIAKQGIGVWNEFDDFVPWDRRVDPDPLTLYVVTLRKGAPALDPFDPLALLLDRDTNLLPGSSLAEAQRDPLFKRFEVVTQCAASKCVKGNVIRGTLKTLHEKPELRGHCKDIVNKLIGVMGRRETTSERTEVFDFLDDALAYRGLAPDSRDEPRAMHPPSAEEGDGTIALRTRSAPRAVADDIEPVWLVSTRRSSTLQDGFRPTWLRIVSECRRRVYVQAREWSLRGRTFIGIKTDCLYFERRCDDVEIPKRRDYASIVGGTWSYSFAPALPMPPRDRRANPRLAAAEEKRDAAAAAVALIRLPPVVKQHSLDDERSPNELIALLDSGSVNIQAYYPGCGKTEAFIIWARKTGKNALVVCPTNALVLAVLRRSLDGLDACTDFKLLGLRLLDGGAGEKSVEEQAPHDVDDIDAILWDEMALRDTTMLARIFTFEEKLRAKRSAAGGRPIHFHYTSDYRQLAPIEKYTRFGADDDYASMAYYESILDRHCPNKLVLRHIKRVDDPAGQALVRQLMDTMWGTPEEQAKGERVEWTAELRETVYALPILARKVTTIDALPDGARAVSFLRATAAAMGRLLHDRAPALAAASDGDRGAPSRAAAAPAPGKKRHPSGSAGRAAKKQKLQLQQGVVVPSPDGISPPMWIANPASSLTALPPHSRPAPPPTPAPPPPVVPVQPQATPPQSASVPLRSHPSDRWVVGQLLRCTGRFRVDKSVFFVNYEYVIQKLKGNVSDASGSAVLTPADAAAGTFKVSVPLTKVDSHFAYVGGQTAHSLQGASVSAPLVLCDTKRGLALGRRWLTTAATRARDMAQLYVWDGKAETLDDAELLRLFRLRIVDYRAQDKKARRNITEEAYLTAEDMLRWAHGSMLCSVCHEPMTVGPGSRMLTADRQSSDEAHHASNCEPTCMTCNRAHTGQRGD